LSPEDIAREYHLPLGAVYEALAYASDHPDEIARLRQTEDQVLERLRAADQRGLGTADGTAKAEEMSGAVLQEMRYRFVPPPRP